MSSINRVTYSGYDFDTILQDLLARLQVKFASDFNDLALSQLGILIIDLMAYGLDGMSFYLDRRATDNYLQTARSRKLVSRITRELGYKMAAATAANVVETVALTTTYAFDVPIPKGYQFLGPRNLIFEVAREVIYTAGSGPSNPQLIPLYEGETVSETFVSSGAANQIFQLRKVPDGKFIVSGTVDILVDGAIWTEQDFLSYGPLDIFEIAYNDEPPHCRFGDGLAGNIPADKAEIIVTYVASSGQNGKVAKNEIRSVVQTLQVSNTPIPLTATNTESSSGGEPPEDIEHAKAYAGLVYKTRKVAVTGQDYESLANSFSDPLFGRVAVAKAFVAKSSAGDITVQNALLNIQNAATLPLAEVTTATNSANTHVDNTLAFNEDIFNAMNQMSGLLATSQSSIDSSLSNVRSARNKCLDIASESANIQTFVISAKAAVLASAATSPEKTAINTILDSLNNEAVNIVTGSSSAVALIESVITDVSSITDNINEIGIDFTIPGNRNYEINQGYESIKAEIGSSVEPKTNLYLDIQSCLDAITDELETISDEVVVINDHLDKVLSADCKANVISVPILARDSAGFYVAPSISLIESLEAYLEERKDLAHTLSVASGAYFLIPAVISVRLGVKRGFSESQVKTTATSAIDSILKNRKFGDSLYVSNLSTSLLQIKGISFADVSILGYTNLSNITDSSKNDAFGDLIIQESEVISKGSVIVITELVL